ncbi:MAG TPA: phosphate ABC transporter permease subunit PstC [bacterium]|nr:phosphate ABC transporter permease subunit PstC [bacterium]HOL35120.1 phosphate ABC transporter permease subunit PstC [bacterium]
MRAFFRTQHSPADFVFRTILLFSGIMLFLLILSIFCSLIINSMPSIKAFGLKFFTGTVWDPVFEQFGALPFVAGTLLTSFIAIIITIPFSIAISIYLGEFSKSGAYSGLLKNSIDLLAGVPSVVYGFFGIFVIVPAVRYIQIRFNIAPYGVGILTASIVLSVMIIPFAASLGREIIEMIPSEIKQAAYALGSTRYEVVRHVIFPYAKSGLIAGILLALGRAIGETMAVTMVIGNSNMMPKTIFAPANTMASIIANEFTEAVSNLHLSSLIEIGVVLFIVTTIISIAGKIIIRKFAVHIS